MLGSQSSPPPHSVSCFYLTLKACWRGFLVRRKIGQREIENAMKNSREGTHTRRPANNAIPRRDEWDRTWTNMHNNKGCADFRDRVRVWQAIAELKRSTGSGHPGSTSISNEEAWIALIESSGSLSKATCLLSSEHRWPDKRLQERQVQEISHLLSLDGPGIIISNNSPNQPDNHQNDEPNSGDAIRPIFTNREAWAEENPGNNEDIFSCVRPVFFPEDDQSMARRR